MKKFLIIFLSLLLASSVWAETKNSSSSSPAAKNPSPECPKIKDDKKRLKCFDDIAKESQKLIDLLSSFQLDSNLKNAFTDPLKKEVDSEAEEKQEKLRKIKQAYINKIELYGVEAGFKKFILEDMPVPAVWFKLKNRGDKTLSGVEVTIFFNDAEGTIIYEEAISPVRVGGIFSTGQPLKPGYIWQPKRGQFYPMKSVPSEWEEGSVSAKITDIEFVE